MGKTTNTLLAFALGAGVGAALGILFAPDTGANTRDKLSFKLSKYKKELEDLINELVDGMDAKGMNHAKDLGWMIDASHNVKDPLEDLLQSVEAIQIAYAQALLVDRKALEAAREANDVVRCQEILQAVFRTDVRALVAQARLELGGALDPIAMFREEKMRDQLIKARGAKTVATGL